MEHEEKIIGFSEKLPGKDFESILSKGSTLFDGLLERMIYFDTELTVRWCNKAAADSLKKRKDEIIGKKCYHVWHNSDKPCKGCPALKSLQTRRIEQTELTFNDGKTLLLRGTPVLNEDDEVSGLIEFARDITEKKVIEQALLKSEEKYKRIVEDQLDYIIRFDAEGRITFLNSRARELFRQDIPILGHDISQYIGEEDKILLDRIQKIKPDRPSVDYTSRILGSKKSFRWVNWKITALFEKDKIVEYQSVGRNITVMKLTEQALKESEMKFRQFTENSREGFLIKTAGKIIYLNSAFANIWNCDKIEIFKYPDNLVHSVYPEDLTKFSLFWNAEPMGVAEEEIRLVNQNNEIIWVWLRVFPIHEDGEMNRFAAIVSDITARKNTEFALAESERRLVQANHAKDKFFSILAHDLKSPLGSMLNMIGLLKNNLVDFSKDELKTSLNDLFNSAEQSKNLLENLLNWSRNQLGSLKVNKEVFSLTNQVRQTLNLFENNFKQKSIRLSNQVKNDYRINTDKEMISVVLRNLISNAIKYTHQGGEIKLWAQRNKNLVKLYIQDSGIGMDHATLDRIFNFDNRISNPGTDNEPGTGLGLLLVKEFCEKCGGTVSVNSKPGKGSVFAVTFPVYSM
ncbi:MAG: PAS domain S-box protein [Bacteroidales bacterium]